jgi:hypothetical protein
MRAIQIGRMNATLTDLHGDPTMMKELTRIPINAHNRAKAFYNFKSIKYPLSNDKS